MNHIPSLSHRLVRWTFWLVTGVRLFDMGCGGHGVRPADVPDPDVKPPTDVTKTDA